MIIETQCTDERDSKGKYSGMTQAQAIEAIRKRVEKTYPGRSITAVEVSKPKYKHLQGGRKMKSYSIFIQVEDFTNAGS